MTWEKKLYETMKVLFEFEGRVGSVVVVVLLHAKDQILVHMHDKQMFYQ